MLLFDAIPFDLSDVNNDETSNIKSQTMPINTIIRVIINKLRLKWKLKQYFNYDNNPDLLLAPKVITYNKSGAEIYTITSKRAQYLDTGINFFNIINTFI
jgi:hypothetical protein